MKVIRGEHISKVYQLGEFSTGTLTRDIERWWHLRRGREDPFSKIHEGGQTPTNTRDRVWSLRDVNFEIEAGDSVGIVGKNGAGKSTLLKILSRITAPTSGSIKGRGRMASLLEVGTGFHQELTGRENVFLNGAILGMRRREIARKFDEIVAFSGIERYIDTPVKRYSSGMYVRLAFAVAAHLDADILVIDEVLAVGDAEFQRKCLTKVETLRTAEGRTVLFVSHNLAAIRHLCHTCLLLKHGQLVEQGETSAVLRSYIRDGEAERPVDSTYVGPITSEKKIWFSKIYPSDSEGHPRNEFEYDEKIGFVFELNYNVPRGEHDYSIFFMVLDANKTRIFSAESEVVTTTIVKLSIEPRFLVRGTYTIHTFVHKPRTEQIDSAVDVCCFHVKDHGSPLFIHGEYDYGSVFGRVSWTTGTTALPAELKSSS